MTKSGKMFFDYVMGFFCVFFDNENCERGNVISIFLARILCDLHMHEAWLA